MDVRLLLGLFLWSSLAFASTPCALPGKLCRVAGEQSNQPECCGGACEQHHCTDGTSTTTLPSVTTTSNSRPTSTSTTLPRPSIPAGSPIRFGPGDVGIRFRASQDMLWNPDTGLPSSQYEAGVRVATMHWVILPTVLRLLRDTPQCSVSSGLGGQVRDMTGKFLILYSLRPMRDGGVYQYRGNYVFDLPMGLFRRAANCVPPEKWGDLAPLFAPGPPPPPHQTSADRSNAMDGLLDPQEAQMPLSARQCTLLEAAHMAHERHVDALLSHDPNAASFGPAVASSQLAFEASARTVTEQAMFQLIFTGAIDPKRSAADVEHFTRETSQAHHDWVDCFHCDTGAPADLLCAWTEQLAHARAHFLRAITLPGLVLRKPCPLDIHYCPVTDD